MTSENVLSRQAWRTFALADGLGSVRAPCPTMRLHHSTLDRWRPRPSATGSATGATLQSC